MPYVVLILDKRSGRNSRQQGLPGQPVPPHMELKLLMPPQSQHNTTYA